MRQLTGVDTTFLHMENARTYGHVNGVVVLDPSTADQPINADTIRDYIAARIHLLDPLRWRLVEVPLGIDRPYWVDDPDLDLNFHVRGIALPAPGNDRQLAEQVARLAARHLDRSKPLWELYVIEGLEGGRVAIMTKLHHAAVDGKSGMHIMSTLLSTDPACPDPEPPTATTAETVPTPIEMWGRGWLGVLSKPAHGARLWMEVSKEGTRMARSLGLGGTDAWRTVLKSPGRAPRLSFNATLGAQRNWAFGSVALSDVKAVKDAHGCTLNDVVMAMCAGALRRWLIDHDELPDKPIVAMVPVSIRTAEDAGKAGNQVSAMVAPLATQLEDPLARLAAASDAMRAAKDQHAALPAHLLQDFSQFAAPAAAQLVADAAANLRWADTVAPPFNVVVSNVPGPREPLYYAGALLEANYPVSIINDGIGLNITLQSYRDRIDFGLVGTPELVPDIWNLITYLQEELALLGKSVA
ncbi:wax ester/triacylglycerol synthase family O-acyltransferase [Nocardioides albidus]|uniref:Diacylglycerol O-acyltransferase n=1 Tax=Nocardioides albidus TaxID=1517589 RepID=A0A5C4VVP1_9ACTN|nr:wax ester/triacylglycerol synthase family O-acyltransferase [Nocardioides albidus]TNM39596.1 wax ester/triacylglycerol synthase family O-acyltransferase [Nocardioides albidus]